MNLSNVSVSFMFWLVSFNYWLVGWLGLKCFWWVFKSFSNSLPPILYKLSRNSRDVWLRGVWGFSPGSLYQLDKTMGTSNWVFHTSPLSYEHNSDQCLDITSTHFQTHLNIWNIKHLPLTHISLSRSIQYLPTDTMTLTWSTLNS